MNPFRYVFWLALTLPFVEIYTLIKAGAAVGAWTTILWLIGAAILGLHVLRLQGAATVRRLFEAQNLATPPVLEMLEAPVVALGAILLIIPGFVTDALGSLLLIPPLRRALIRRFLRHASVVVTAPPSSSRSGPKTIEGEFTRE